MPAPGGAGAGAARRGDVDPDRLPDRRSSVARRGHPRVPARPARLRARCSRSRTAPTTPRRRWGSSSWRSWPTGTCRRPPTSRPGWSSAPPPRSRPAPTSAAGGSSARWARRIIKMDPAQGFAAQTRGRGGDPLGLARRLPALHDARDVRRDHGRGRGQAALRRALGRGRQHRRRPGC